MVFTSIFRTITRVAPRIIKTTQKTRPEVITVKRPLPQPQQSSVIGSYASKPIVKVQTPSTTAIHESSSRGVNILRSEPKSTVSIQTSNPKQVRSQNLGYNVQKSVSVSEFGGNLINFKPQFSSGQINLQNSILIRPNPKIPSSIQKTIGDNIQLRVANSDIKSQGSVQQFIRQNDLKSLDVGGISLGRVARLSSPTNVRYFQKGDILFSRVGTVGKVRQFDVDTKILPRGGDLTAKRGGYGLTRSFDDPAFEVEKASFGFPDLNEIRLLQSRGGAGEIFYHGTTTKNAPIILKNGFNLKSKGLQAGAEQINIDGVYLAGGSKFASEQGEIVLATTLKNNAKVITTKEINQNVGKVLKLDESVKYAKSNNYDVLKGFEGTNPVAIVLNKEAIFSIKDTSGKFASKTFIGKGSELGVQDTASRGGNILGTKVNLGRGQGDLLINETPDIGLRPLETLFDHDLTNIGRGRLLRSIGFDRDTANVFQKLKFNEIVGDVDNPKGFVDETLGIINTKTPTKKSFLSKVKSNENLRRTITNDGFEINRIKPTAKQTQKITKKLNSPIFFEDATTIIGKSEIEIFGSGFKAEKRFANGFDELIEDPRRIKKLRENREIFDVRDLDDFII